MNIAEAEAVVVKGRFCGAPRTAIGGYIAGLLGQSSAAQTNSGRTVPPLSKSVGSGAHGAATRCRPGIGPGKIVSPSPHSRAGPQTKHSGVACSVNPR